MLVLSLKSGIYKGTNCYFIPGISCTVAGRLSIIAVSPSGICKIPGEKVAASQFGSFRQKEHATKTRVHNI